MVEARADQARLEVLDLHLSFGGVMALAGVSFRVKAGEILAVVGRALMAHPRLMLLDEPSLGLAPPLVQEIFQIIKRINVEEKTSILLVEQNAMAALAIADYGYVMDNGRVALDGSAEKLRDNEDIKEFYLGLSDLGQRKSYREVKHYKRRKRWLA